MFQYSRTNLLLLECLLTWLATQTLFSVSTEGFRGIIYELRTLTSEKELGITFQHDMKFDIHINNIVNKANRLLGLVKRTFSYMDKNTLLITYKSIIRPIIDYGDSVWNPSLKMYM